MKEELTNLDWKSATAEQSLSKLCSTEAGLSAAEARARLAQYGPNALPQAQAKSALRRFLQQFHNVLIYVLLASVLITALLDHLIDSLVILAVVLANAVIGFLQEGKAEQALKAIGKMLAPTATVVREGHRRSIGADELVPGDIVLLEAGDKVPADLRLLHTHGLQIQEAVLTGESLPVEKNTQVLALDTALGDCTCLAFSGTLVSRGQGSGVVVKTGATTEIGRISGMLSEIETLTTPLLRQMDVFARWLTGIILLLAAMLLGFGYFIQHLEFTDLFMAIVGLSVAAIPEGLPAVLTITLAIGVQAMARRKAIVRRLAAIETLGSVSVICTDKTGTLTLNEMMVTAVLGHGRRFSVSGAGYGSQGEILPVDNGAETDQHSLVPELVQELIQEMGRTACLCNDAALREHDGLWQVEGDPMEGALLAFARKTGIDPDVERKAWTRTDVIPFDASHRLMASLNHDHAGKAFIFVKGAPEQVLACCQEQRSVEGEKEVLDHAQWQAQIHDLASQGLRVLALALKPVEPQHTVLEFTDIEQGMILLGMVGLMDPPRPEAVMAVQDCHAAGIRVKMITGDHASTAGAIGRQVGLKNTAQVLTGADIDALDDAALARILPEVDIFARTSPEHKLRLVKALQADGMAVAMTGDGVNDAPALKRADVGIAMGRKGSEAAREAAAMVLADDNFASIVAAVREGRTVYDNLKKVISWTLPTSSGEAMTIIVALLFGMTLPITPVQILWVNLITAATLGIALAFEPTEENTMLRPPRPQQEALLGGELVWHIVLVSGLFLAGVFGMYVFAGSRGYSIELARTLVLNTLVVMEIFHLFFIRNIYGTSLTWQALRGTRVIWAVVVIVTLAQFLVTYLPALQRVFATEPVSLPDGLLIVGVGVLLFAIIESEKQLRLYWRRR
ncbi:MAG: cation-transporting P-type ATPase [Pseudomonadales bacterium]|nr:cation-transporting P-type ATPase [Pseudomonadales bacterium]